VKTRALWADRTKFAEYAEALDVTTEEIAAAMETPGHSAVVLYSVGTEPDAAMHRALLGRDEDGVPDVLADQVIGTLAGFQAQVEAVLLGGGEGS